jgi:hypothetical protein
MLYSRHSFSVSFFNIGCVGDAEHVRKHTKRASKKEYVVFKQQQLPAGKMNMKMREKEKEKKKKKFYNWFFF